MWEWLDRLRDACDGAEFVVRFRPGRPARVRGRVPLSKHAVIRQFFETDLGAAGPVRVRGRRDPRGRLALEVAGRLDPARRQRLRNFLLDLLD